MGKFAKRINQYAATQRRQLSGERFRFGLQSASHDDAFGYLSGRSTGKWPATDFFIGLSSYQHGRTHAANVAADLARAAGLKVHTIGAGTTPPGGRLLGSRFDWFDSDPDLDYVFGAGAKSISWPGFKGSAAGTGVGETGNAGFGLSNLRWDDTGPTRRAVAVPFDPSSGGTPIRIQLHRHAFGQGVPDELRDIFYKPHNYIAGIDPTDGAGRSNIGIFQRGGIDGHEVHYLSFDPDQQEREFKRQVRDLAERFSFGRTKIIERTFDPRNPGRQRGGRIGHPSDFVPGDGLIANFARYNDRFSYNPWEPSYFRWYVGFLDNVCERPTWARLLPTLDQLRDGGGSYLAQLDRRFARHYFERPPNLNVELIEYIDLSGTNRFVDEQRALSAFWKEWWDRLLFGNSSPVPGEN